MKARKMTVAEYIEHLAKMLELEHIPVPPAPLLKQLHYYGAPFEHGLAFCKTLAKLQDHGWELTGPEKPQ